MTYGQCTDRANTFFIYILAGSYDFCRVVTAGVLTFFGSKNDFAPALLYSQYCTAPNHIKMSVKSRKIDIGSYFCPVIISHLMLFMHDAGLFMHYKNWLQDEGVHRL